MHTQVHMSVFTFKYYPNMRCNGVSSSDLCWQNSGKNIYVVIYSQGTTSCSRTKNRIFLGAGEKDEMCKC